MRRGSVGYHDTDPGASIFPNAPQHAFSFCDALVAAFEQLGITQAFGLVGGPIAPFSESLARSNIRVVHCRHEGGAAFCATEAYFASGKPSLVFATTGPGFFNALTGLAAARWEGAKVIAVSGATSAPQRGRWAAQETSPHTTLISGLYTSGPLFHFAHQLEDVSELQLVTGRLCSGLAQPQGFVAHLSLPISLQTAAAPPHFKMPNIVYPPCGSSAGAELCASLLTHEKFGIWVGFGARHAAHSVLELAERTGCGVFCSPRAKGIFPEDHPQFMGVTGLGGHASVEAYVQAEQPQFLLVLGTRMGEATSYWSPRLAPTGGFIHVDIDRSVQGSTYPTVKTVAIQADIESFLRDLLARLPTHLKKRLPAVVERNCPALQARDTRTVRPEFVMQQVQKHVIDNADLVVMTESGNSAAWGNHMLRFAAPNRYRVSTSYGSMGHFVCGVVGAALARGTKVVAIVGDGAMLMNNEISTAVRYRADAIWIVLNDGQYGMVEQGMRALGFKPVETALPDTDFAAMAHSMGAAGIRVEYEGQLAQALQTALQMRGPVVLDILIDKTVASPVLRRIECLKEQGAIRRHGEG